MKQNETNETDLGEKGEKGEPLFFCSTCGYKCSVKFSYDRHLLTAKHMSQSQMKQNETNETKKEKKEKKEKNMCECGICYHSRTSLWRHKKTCNVVQNFEIKEQKNETNHEGKDELINYLIKENQEFKNLILEIIKKDTITNNNNNINNNTINSHNKTFNLQFFLNETCKDAMNLMDFVDSIKLQLSDLESVGKLGYVEGISKIIVNKLNLLDETKRPVHCADSKREVMYVKDDNKWEKENQDKSKLRNAIKCVSRKNSKLLKDFRVQYPDCDKSDSKYSTKYDKITLEAFGGKGDDYEEKENKIIKNIAKNVTIDKTINKPLD